MIRRWLVAVVLIASGCQKPAGAPAEPAKKAGPPTVTLGKPQKLALKRTIEQPGQIEAIEHTALFARVPGYVKSVKVDIGDPVTEGQLLAELSTPDLDQDVKQKEALTRQATAEVEQARQAALAAGAAFRSAAALAEEAKSGEKRVLSNVERWKSETERVTVLANRQVIDQQARS